jgi:hypothetical protein
VGEVWGSKMLQVCETIYGRERAAKLQAYIEDATGEPCPCKRGISCLLMPTPRATTEDPEWLGSLTLPV